MSEEIMDEIRDLLEDAPAGEDVQETLVQETPQLQEQPIVEVHDATPTLVHEGNDEHIPDFKTEKLNDGKTFLDLFCQTFDQYSYNNGLYGRLCAHVLLGQKLRNTKIYFGPFYIDPRVSIFIMQPSGTGKSVAYDMIDSVGKASDIKMNDIDEATDAALVGSVEQEEVVDEETGKKKTTYNTKLGLLSNSDILHYDEGKMLVTKQQYSQNTLAWLQKALNPIGSGQNHCTKNLAHGDPIEFYPTCGL